MVTSSLSGLLSCGEGIERSSSLSFLSSLLSSLMVLLMVLLRCTLLMDLLLSASFSSPSDRIRVKGKSGQLGLVLEFGLGTQNLRSDSKLLLRVVLLQRSTRMSLGSDD